MKIFISYSRKDYDLVTKLIDDLQALGHAPWFDRELARTGGQKWWDNVLENIRNCDLFVFALTPSSLTSQACQREYHYAHDLNKRILPVMLEQVDIPTLPTDLQELQVVNYMHRTDKQILALAGTLNGLRPAQPMPDPLPPEPPVPVSPMGRIASLLEKPSLTNSEQIEAFFELDTLFHNPTTRSGAENLLRQLHDREDTTRSVADKIRGLIPDISGPQPIPAKRQTEKPAPPRSKGNREDQNSNTALPVRGIAVVVVVLVVLAIGGVILQKMASGSPTPTPESPTKVAQVPTSAGLPTSTVTSSPVPATSLPTDTALPPTATFEPTTTNPTNIPTITTNSQWNPQTQPFDGVDMMLVPPGCFNMGSTSAQINAEKKANPGFETYLNAEGPQSKVCFDKAFWIDKTDVTQAQFRQFGGQAAHPPSFAGDNRPVDSITWFEASNYCIKQRSARLPTEAEWEYAARGPDDLVYPWGNTYVADNAVDHDNSNQQSADVGSKPNGKSWVGALDMSGNVWNWTSSLYKPYPYKADDGRESNSDTSSDRVRRGGSWYFGSSLLRLAYRSNDYPSNQGADYGFRCARSF